MLIMLIILIMVNHSVILKTNEFGLNKLRQNLWQMIGYDFWRLFGARIVLSESFWFTMINQWLTIDLQLNKYVKQSNLATDRDKSMKYSHLPW